MQKKKKKKQIAEIMQSRLTAFAVKSNRAFSPTRFHHLRRAPAYSSTAENDPAAPATEPEESQDLAEPENTKANYETRPSRADCGPFAPPKPHLASSPRLESTAVGHPSKPITQQKRTQMLVAGDVGCVGEIGKPWPDDGELKQTDRDEQREDDKEYYKHHKASPLSQVEFADTRKPLTQATDGTANSGYYGGGGDVVGWLPEQLDTAEEALRRATEIWKQNAERGDPDAPHSRVLRTLRGEWF